MKILVDFLVDIDNFNEDAFHSTVEWRCFSFIEKKKQ